MSDTIPSGADDPAASDWRRRWARHRTLTWVGIIVGLVVAVAVGGFVIRVDKVAFVPGGVQATSGLVEIDGAETYEADGELYYTTVRIPRLSVWEWLWYSMDDDADIRDEDEVFGSQTAEETRRCNLQMMRTSKSTAVLVALTKLDYDPVTPTGAAVELVQEETPAATAVDCGDVIVGVQVDGANEEIDTAQDLAEAIGGLAPGTVVELEVEGLDGAVRTEVVTLADNGQGEGFLGVRTGTRFDENELEVDVAISTGNVGGPSAGLAFSLAVMNALTPTDLTGGAEVSVTGTISLDERVGPVGGVRQKVIAAREAGSDLFLMPELFDCMGEPECEGIVEQERLDICAGAGDMPVVEVATLDEALNALSGERAAACEPTLT